MSFARRAGLTYLASLFSISLLAFVMLISLWAVLGTSGPLKTALAESGIYQSVVGNILEQSSKENTTTPGAIEVNTPEIKQRIQNAFPPGDLQTNVEKMIDGTYAWLQGKTPAPSFSIDFSQNKTALADSLSGYASERLAALPPCSPATNTAGFNALNATCLPPGLDTNTAAQQVKDDIANNKEFLDNPTITADEIKNDQGQNLTEQLQVLQRLYRSIVWGAIITALLALATAAGVIFWSAERLKGVGRVAKTVLTTGISLLLLGWIGVYLFERLTTSALKNASPQPPLQNEILQAILSLLGDFRVWWLGFGIAFVIIGGGLLFWLRLKQKSNPSPPINFSGSSAAGGRAS